MFGCVWVAYYEQHEDQTRFSQEDCQEARCLQICLVLNKTQDGQNIIIQQVTTSYNHAYYCPSAALQCESGLLQTLPIKCFIQRWGVNVKCQDCQDLNDRENG